MIHFQLVSLSGLKFDEDVYEVVVPTIGGAIAVFGEHMPIVSAAEPGVISIRKSSNDTEMINFATNGGVIEVDGQSIRFLADDVASPDEIIEDEAADALKRAEQLVKEAKNPIDLSQARRQVQSSSTRLHVARLKKRHHQ